MDWVAGKDGQLVPLDFDEDASSKMDPSTGEVASGVSDSERDGIRGRNTWLLWGGGNEAFWGWLQERGYGLTDYLILMDSRQRANRFKTAGMINQPGFESSTKTILGLYFDQPKGGDWRNAMLRPPPQRDASGKPIVKPYEGAGYDQPEPELYDAQGRKLDKPVELPKPPPGHPTDLFEPWTTLAEWEKQKMGNEGFKDYIPEVVQKKLPQDGLDPAIYGYPSGIFGLRLMLNPDFFAKTAAAEMARSYWKKQVETTNGRYYTEKTINADPNLVRPFRVTMSCGFCHVAQHPLNPPARDDEPEWENLSSIIGAQYWDPQAANANLQKRPGFLHHFLKSQAPGTIDTSLVSTDHINNTNVINPIFDVPARLARAMAKPAEEQSRENLQLPSLEDPETSQNPDGPNKLRHFPMVLGPGEDSVGVFGALERVPHNVGVFPEMWFTTGNLVLGYTPQRPFRLDVGRANSVYWNVNVKYRVPYMAKFFEVGHRGIVAKSTAGMKLKDAGRRDADGNPLAKPLAGQVAFAADTDELRAKGRQVFLDNCAICHSSKLPKGYDLHFQRESPAAPAGWEAAPAPPAGHELLYQLPMEYRHWNDFRTSPAMADFRKRIALVAGDAPQPGQDDPFLKDNFLSNELRIPITLVGTYAGRALATNAMRGNVWDNYSSETFKKLSSVGKIRYFNPYATEASAVQLDPYGTNADFDDGRKEGGPGYFRPATLISIWASAPFLHNNALGIYTQDPSVEGRMLAFDDAVRKLLWNKERTGYSRKERASGKETTYIPPGDLRPEGSTAAANDPGYIYRLPVDTRIQFQPGFTPLLIQGLLAGFVGRTFGGILFTVLTFWWWVLLTALYAFLIFKGRARLAGGLLLLISLGLAAVVALLELGGLLWLIVAVLAAVGLGLLLARREWKIVTRGIFVIATLVTLFAGILTNKFLTGHLKQVNLVAAVLPNCWLNADYQGLDVGPIPRGTPVNLLMSLDPDLRKIDKIAPALVGLTRAMVKINKDHLTGEQAYKVLAEKAGPALMAASKCPDFVLDRGHWFGETLNDDPKTDEVAWEKKNDELKEALIAFLKTL
jgi:cytochrome c5